MTLCESCHNEIHKLEKEEKKKKTTPKKTIKRVKTTKGHEVTENI
jgi:hypothetical protein